MLDYNCMEGSLGDTLLMHLQRSISIPSILQRHTNPILKLIYSWDSKLVEELFSISTGLVNCQWSARFEAQLTVGPHHTTPVSWQSPQNLPACVMYVCWQTPRWTLTSESCAIAVSAGPSYAVLCASSHRRTFQCSSCTCAVSHPGPSPANPVYWQTP